MFLNDIELKNAYTKNSSNRLKRRRMLFCDNCYMQKTSNQEIEGQNFKI